MALHRYPVGPVVEAEIWAPAGTDIGETPQVNRGTAPMPWSPAKNSVAAMRLGMYQDRTFMLRTIRGAR